MYDEEDDDERQEREELGARLPEDWEDELRYRVVDDCYCLELSLTELLHEHLSDKVTNAAEEAVLEMAENPLVDVVNNYIRQEESSSWRDVVGYAAPGLGTLSSCLRLGGVPIYLTGSSWVRTEDSTVQQLADWYASTWSNLRVTPICDYFVQNKHNILMMCGPQCGIFALPAALRLSRRIPMFLFKENGELDVPEVLEQLKKWPAVGRFVVRPEHSDILQHHELQLTVSGDTYTVTSATKGKS